MLSSLSFFFFFFLHNDDKRGINQIDKVACISFVRARFGRRSAGTHWSDRCDGQMEDAAAEANLAMVRLEKQWKEESWFARRRWVWTCLDGA